MTSSLECLFSIKGHVALQRDPEPGYNTLLLRLIPGYLYSACSYRQLPGLLHNQIALPNSYPNTCMPFYDGLWYDLPGASTAWEADMLTTKPSRRGPFS